MVPREKGVHNRRHGRDGVAASKDINNHPVRDLVAIICLGLGFLELDILVERMLSDPRWQVATLGLKFVLVLSDDAEREIGCNIPCDWLRLAVSGQ